MWKLVLSTAEEAKGRHYDPNHIASSLNIRFQILQTNKKLGLYFTPTKLIPQLAIGFDNSTTSFLKFNENKDYLM